MREIIRHHLKKRVTLKRIQKTLAYARWRRYFPMAEDPYVDDRDKLDVAEVVNIDWPEVVKKPRVGVVKDRGHYPRWTKYFRFLENNAFPYCLYDIHSHDWLDKARDFDVVVGIVHGEVSNFREIQEKYYFLETGLGIKCYPSSAHAFLYEDKMLEAYLSQLLDIPYAKTYISHLKEDALALTEMLKYPLVSKVSPSSGSVGVELLRTPKEARRVVRAAFSRNGRKVHVPYFRQKDYVYFQEFIPNDGYDIRVIVVGNWAFGYYRKAPKGDFRASGMGESTWEKRALPEEAIRVAWKANQRIQSPLLAVDMVHGRDGRYTIIEFSPFCQLDSPEELMVNGVPGVYIVEESGGIRFQEGRYWVAELALREFFVHDYLPAVLARPTKS